MIKSVLLSCLLFCGGMLKAETIVVKNLAELQQADKKAKAGDIIVLQNGQWHDVTISLKASGTAMQPVVYKAETAGKVIITGQSKLLIGGNYIVIDGWYFTNGYANNDPAIKFRTSKEQVANNCRVTNTVINDFNNPKRMDDNYWVMLYGKNNRIDHCSFLNKKNMGVLMAVILDDERSRENFHSIDHNYFGVRLPLASNTGEIVRVGVSEHCEFNSNTSITDNFFEHCDGETEIISIKSGSNIVKNNLFKECQGTVVLRHGNYNTVENNVFLGNGKTGTGGVRIINKGQWVVNNLFYKCRGEGFRSPLAIMNGVPNSPANRYVAVTDAVVANNSWVDCTPISFCEGSDTERSVPPKDVRFLNNLFTTTLDKIIYNSFDDMSGINFTGNAVAGKFTQPLLKGFIRTTTAITKTAAVNLPLAQSNAKPPDWDSLEAIAKTRISGSLNTQPGFSGAELLSAIVKNSSNCGAEWFKQIKEPTVVINSADCKNAAEIMAALADHKGGKLTINLTGTDYHFTAPLSFTSDIVLTGNQKKLISFSYESNDPFLLSVKAGHTLSLLGLNLKLADVKTNNFISTDTSGSSNHSDFIIKNCLFSGYNGVLFYAAKSSVADGIIFTNNNVANGKGKLFSFDAETDKKGYYNVEKLFISNCIISDFQGQIISMLRGGNDESTMGPLFKFNNNIVTNANTSNDQALIHLFGTQLSYIQNNIFKNSNKGKTAILYEDKVRAVHQLQNNIFSKSGKVDTDKFVERKGNINKQ